MLRLVVVISIIAALLSACINGDTASTVTPEVTATPIFPATPESTPTSTATASASPVRMTPTPTSDFPPEFPAGFPLDPHTVLGMVTGDLRTRTITWDAGPSALAYSRDDQASEDPDRANRSGWNGRLHVEYEGQAAVDWYIPTGTAIFSTMAGTATLSIVTTTNAFDHYDVDREPYLGNPDRSRAPFSPFPGPGSGKGVFVTVVNDEFVTEYAHLKLRPTLEIVPSKAFLAGFGRDADYSAFSAMRSYLESTPIASWTVARGELLGYSGDSGYSEAPHLHYTIARRGGPLLCPTEEPGFENGGWLFR